MKHGEIPRRFPSPREGRSRRDTQDPEVTDPPEQFSASLARLHQALLSPALSSRQSQGTLPSTRVQGWSQPVPALTLGCNSVENGVFYLYVSGFI